MTVTCHTPDCANADQAIDLGPGPFGDVIICGPCGVEITDLV